MPGLWLPNSATPTKENRIPRFLDRVRIRVPESTLLEHAKIDFLDVMRFYEGHKGTAIRINDPEKDDSIVVLIDAAAVKEAGVIMEAFPTIALEVIEEAKPQEQDRQAAT